MLARFVLGLAVVFVGTSAIAQERAPLVAQGKKLFVEQGCYGCHTVAGTANGGEEWSDAFVGRGKGSQ